MAPRPARHLVRWFLRRFGYRGITLPPFGIYLLEHSMMDERLIRHEQAHWAQYKRMGLVHFYCAYLWGLIRHGYFNHPMEREAREAER